jgi:hypothetical protein
MMVSGTEIIQRRMTGRLMNEELERKWKRAVVAYFRLRALHSPGGTDESQKTPGKTVGVPAQMRTSHLPNTSQKGYHLNLFALNDSLFTLGILVNTHFKSTGYTEMTVDIVLRKT